MTKVLQVTLSQLAALGVAALLIWGVWLESIKHQNALQNYPY